MIETIWLMESECCDTCGAMLDYFESVLCTDCVPIACMTPGTTKIKIGS